MTRTDNKRLRNVRRAREKKALKKALKKASPETSAITGITSERSTPAPMSTSLSIPRITEDDLLAFQFSHFGDDSKPQKWFVDAQTALAVPQEPQPVSSTYYRDGTKRTLTDEQITMFRHTEIHKLLAQFRAEVTTGEEEVAFPEAGPRETCGTASQQSINRKRKSKRAKKKQAHNLSAGTLRARDHDIPYERRNKRKWEQHIQEEDDIRGALTSRRLARELDEVSSESVEMDYG